MGTLEDQREDYTALIRLQILHHAAEGPIYGLWMIEELAHHGMGRQDVLAPSNQQPTTAY